MGDTAVLYFVAHSFVSPLVASASNAVTPSLVRGAPKMTSATCLTMNRHQRTLGWFAHEILTLLLDNGVPVHVVAARCGHDPATLLRSYAKRTRKADTSATSIIGSISKGILGN